MTHKFNPEKWRKLEAPERVAALPPETLLDEIGLEAGQTLIDVGAGTGFFAIPAANRVGPNGKVYAADISPEMLARLQERIKDPNLPLEIIQSKETHIPLPDHLADHVLVALVFHEIAPVGRETFITELKRLVRPDGGRISILDWAPGKPAMGPPDRERVPLETVTSVVEKAGLQLTIQKPIGKYYYLVQGLS